MKNDQFEILSQEEQRLLVGGNGYTYQAVEENGEMETNQVGGLGGDRLVTWQVIGA